MELMRGGELFDQIADRGRFSEKDASMVMRSIVQAISFLHLHHIIHRDLKPENVLCKDSSWPLVVKLSDFGLASATEDKINDGELIGTPGYVAPEVVMRKPYDFAVDMWAAGVILYIMLSGKMPFFGKTDRECLRKIATGRYAFPPKQWSTVSEDAQSLIRSLLQVDPAKRLTAVAALNHRWLCEPHTCCSEPLTNDLRELHSTKRKFRKAVNAVITLKKLSQLSQEEL
uniref:Protein kinase domain-containing protein n=2 Tax=Rhodosorus marinus TaxID=101924 RepID=A0A7S0G7T2_9RHOD|mmetsp:Transcript_4665/g.6450  ORF Transcript_4665/g.6450 Transcript_4665/m.6450 type:complete len:229 (+) Transcript_4665:792-1478(+)